MRYPSIRQVKTLQYVAQGMSRRASMIKAGYRISSANQSTRAMKTKSMVSLIETFALSLEKKGITLEFYTTLFHKWLTAKKLTPYGEAEDYATQMKAFSILQNFKQSNPENNGYDKKKSISFEEFIGELKDEEQEAIISNHSNGYNTNFFNEVNQQEIINAEVQEASAVKKQPEEQPAQVYDESWKQLVNWEKFNSWKLYEYEKSDLLRDVKNVLEYEIIHSPPFSPEFVITKGSLIGEAIRRGYDFDQKPFIV